MAYSVRFKDTARKQFERLDKPVQKRITKFITTRLETAADPRRIGEATVGEFAGFWKYRIGDYRLVCEIRDRELIVMVIKIGHRRDVYR